MMGGNEMGEVRKWKNYLQNQIEEHYLTNRRSLHSDFAHYQALESALEYAKNLTVEHIPNTDSYSPSDMALAFREIEEYVYETDGSELDFLYHIVKR